MQLLHFVLRIKVHLFHFPRVENEADPVDRHYGAGVGQGKGERGMGGREGGREREGGRRREKGEEKRGRERKMGEMENPF